MTPLVAIDFGTCNTAAVIRLGDGRQRHVLFDGAPLLPSGVFATSTGEVVAGRDATLLAAQEPARFEPTPKRRVDDGTVLLGQEWPVEELIAAVLRRVAAEATRLAGEPVNEAVLTHPSAWGPRRRATLTAAASRAGLSVVALVEEPIAAAAYYSTVLGHRLPYGTSLAVFDFGGGTLDLAVVEHAADGPRVTATAGLDDLGGLDLDAAVVASARAGLSTEDPAQWQWLDRPVTDADRLARAALWSAARAAKEMLSRAASAPLPTPGRIGGTHLTRDEFEAAAAPLLGRAVDAAQRLFAGKTLVGPFLVGGSSRVPLVAHLLHRALGQAPTVLEQPELAVAEGALAAAAPQLPQRLLAALREIPQRSADDVAADPAVFVERPEPPARRSRQSLLVGLTVAALVAAGAGFLVWNWPNGSPDITGAGGGANGGPPATGTTGGSSQPGAAGGTPALTYQRLNPSRVATSSDLKTAAAPWDTYRSWTNGCRIVDDDAHRPDGRLGNPHASDPRSASPPREAVNCNAGSFELILAAYPAGTLTNVWQMYTNDSTYRDPTIEVPAWTPTSHALLYRASDTVLAVLISTDASADLKLVYERYKS